MDHRHRLVVQHSYHLSPVATIKRLAEGDTRLATSLPNVPVGIGVVIKITACDVLPADNLLSEFSHADKAPLN